MPYIVYSMLGNEKKRNKKSVTSTQDGWLPLCFRRRKEFKHTTYNIQHTTYNIQHTTYAKRGFTLMETLVGMTVLIIAVTGTLSIISRNVSSAAIAKERVTAFYLAQEAIEFVRGVRDNNAINGRSWLNGLDNCIGQKCTIDVTPGGIVEDCSGFDCTERLYVSNDGAYNQQGAGIETIFMREVEIVQTLDREARIDVTLMWMQGSLPRDFTISGTIFNWR